MLSNAYFLEKIRFDTAENEPAKKLQNFRKMHFRKCIFRQMHFRKCYPIRRSAPVRGPAELPYAEERRGGRGTPPSRRAAHAGLCKRGVLFFGTGGRISFEGPFSVASRNTFRGVSRLDHPRASAILLLVHSNL